MDRSTLSTAVSSGHFSPKKVAALLSAVISVAVFCAADAVARSYPFGPRTRSVNDLGNQYVPWITGDSAPILGILVRTERVPDTASHSDIPSAMWNHGQWFRSDRIIGWATNQAAIRAALPTCKFS